MDGEDSDKGDNRYTRNYFESVFRKVPSSDSQSAILHSQLNCERDCSAAEYIINKRQAWLHPNKVKQILFLN